MKADKIQIGVVGVGARGAGLLKHLVKMQDIRITAICDVYQDRVDQYTAFCKEKTGYLPNGFVDYTAMLQRSDIDAVIIPTPMILHAKITMAFLAAGKAVATEVGGAASLEECWELVRASETANVPCMMLENCCYDRKQMALLHMVHKGAFGELVYCKGGYLHDLRKLLVDEHDKNRHTRIYNYIRRNGDIYPTHGLGPIAKMLHINRGNRMVSLTAMASKAVGMHEWIAEHKDAGHEMANATFMQGDIVNTVITCAGGEQIVLTHDTTLPRPYSRGGLVQGTKGIWAEPSIYKENEVPFEHCKSGMIYLDNTTPLAGSRKLYREMWQSFDSCYEKYEHPLWKAHMATHAMQNDALSSGMDVLVLRAFIECVQEGTRPAVDVYDSASWMAITCLSENSIANGSNPVSIPDFTNGKWIEPRLDTTSLHTLDVTNT